MPAQKSMSSGDLECSAQIKDSMVHACRRTLQQCLDEGGSPPAQGIGELLCQLFARPGHGGRHTHPRGQSDPIQCGLGDISQSTPCNSIPVGT